MAVYTEIHVRRDSTLNWYASNPRLALGEPGIDMDLHRFKIGNGIDRWNQLPYMDDDLYKLLDKQAQEAADRAQDLLNQIRANKLAAEQNHNAVTTELRNTSRSLNDRMTSVETEQEEYESGLTKRQDDYEEYIAERQSEYEDDLTDRQDKYEFNLTSEFEDTRADVDAGLEEFNETRDKLNVRMDAIVGQNTEYTEILDARVDAEYKTHPNLGANIRNIHTQLFEAKQTEVNDKAELEESISVLREMNEAEKAERISSNQEQDAEINRLSYTAEKLNVRDDHLQEQTDDLSAIIVKEMLTHYEDIQALNEEMQTEYDNLSSEILKDNQEAQEVASRTRQEVKAVHEHLQEQSDELSAFAIEEKLSRLEDKQELENLVHNESLRRISRDDELQKESETVLRLSSEHSEFLQEQIDETASVLQEATIATWRTVQELKREDISLHDEIDSKTLLLKAEQNDKAEKAEAKHSEYAEYIREQVNDSAVAILNESLGRYQDNQKAAETKSKFEYLLSHEQHERECKDTCLQENIEIISRQRYEHGEHLQEQINENALSVIQMLGRNSDTEKQLTSYQKHEASIREQEDKGLQEQVNDNAVASLQQVLTLAHEAEERRKLEQVVENIKSPVDWSTFESLAIPEPRCAVVNFTGLKSMPTSKIVEIPAYIEFWDMQGNYFKKSIMCSAQGASSLGYVKKNLKFDLLNDDGSEFDLKIGNWVVQDGFHLKAYYTDFFRGIAVTSYKLWDEIMETKPFKKALVNINGMNNIANGAGNVSDLSLQIDTGALCHPDGFPCIVYLNGEFYGVYSWQIKKQRKNYHLEKSTAEHIHLDGNIYAQHFWNGTINWTAFEIRNPNKLYTMDGKKYDGDAPRELIDETAEKYDPSNKDHVRSAKVKKYIQNLVHNFNEFKQLYTTYGRNKPEIVRAKYEEIFEWSNQRDYLIFSDITNNWDGIYGRNVQVVTYDGIKWFFNAYDLDCTFGGNASGTYIRSPLIVHSTTSTALPTYYVVLLYKNELEARYRQLRDAGIINVEHIVSKLEDWTSRIGENNYKLEYDRWPNSPCLLSYNDSVDRVRKWIHESITNMDDLYNYKTFTLTEAIRLHEDDVKSIKTSVKLSDEVAARIRFDNDTGLREEINDVSVLMLQFILANYDAQERTNARLRIVEEALVANGVLDESDIPYTIDTDIRDMFDDIFSGLFSSNDSTELLGEDNKEFLQDLDNIFNF